MFKLNDNHFTAKREVQTILRSNIVTLSTWILISCFDLIIVHQHWIVAANFAIISSLLIDIHFQTSSVYPKYF